MNETTADLRKMYDALAGLLKASVLYRSGSATLDSLVKAEERAMSALKEKHEEYIKIGDPTVPETEYPTSGVTQSVNMRQLADAIVTKSAPLERKKLKARPINIEKKARNAEIQQKMTALFSGQPKAVAYRALAKEFNVSPITVQFIVERRGSYANN